MDGVARVGLDWGCGVVVVVVFATIASPSARNPEIFLVAQTFYTHPW